MHELSLCRSIVRIVESARGDRTVDVIHLRVGQLRQVMPETLEHCWSLVTEQSTLQGSRLEIDHVPIRLRCGDCAADTTAPDRLLLVCGTCGSGWVTVMTGEEFIVTSMDVRTEEIEHAHG